MKATDLDEGMNSQVLYSISHTQPPLTNTFTIDNTTGVVRLSRPVDYERLTSSGQIMLGVQACDRGLPSLCSVINATVEVEVKKCTHLYSQMQPYHKIHEKTFNI